MSIYSHDKAKTHASIAVKDLERSVMLLKSKIEEADATSDLATAKMTIND